MGNGRGSPQGLAERALELSTMGRCAVIVEEESAANLRWACNSLTTNGMTHRRVVTVVAIHESASGESVGVVSRSGMAPESLESLVRAAEASARSGTVAEDAQPFPEGVHSPDWDAPPGATSIHVLADVARSLGDAFAKARREGRDLFGYAQHSVKTVYLATTTGLRLRHDRPFGYAEINAKSAASPASAWIGAATESFDDVDVLAMDAELTRRLGWARRTVELPPGRYETILPPCAVADLMVQMYMAMGTRDAIAGHSAFSRPGGGTRIGERLTDTALTLRSDPRHPEGACCPFVVASASGGRSSVFDNGLPLQPTSWVTRGELSALVQTRHSAALSGLPITPEIDNLVLEGHRACRDVDGMVGETSRGLLLTCLWYLNEIDPRSLLLTGLTRDGVFLIQGGEVIGAVNNFRFNESPLDILNRVDAIGVSRRTLSRQWRDLFPRTVMPALRVVGFNMATASPSS